MTSLPYATPLDSPQLPFKDQRGGLKIMGVVLIVLGGFSACISAITPAAILLPRPPGTPAPMVRDVIAGVLLYVLAAPVLITAGAGSLRIQRWSRPAILIITGTWAVMGILGFLFWVFLAPDMEQVMRAAVPPPPPGAPGAAAPPAMSSAMIRVMGIVGGVFMLVFMVLLPAGFFWFYRRDVVQQTLDYFDPEPAWTDRCPTPVLAMSGWLAVGSLLVLSFCLWGVVPAFGVLISGRLAIAILIGMAALLALLAWGMFRLQPAAWWATLLLVLVVVASIVLTFSRVDPFDLYRRAGTPPEQIDMMQKMGANTAMGMVLSPIVYGLAGFAYLLWIRKYFRRGETVPAAPAA